MWGMTFEKSKLMVENGFRGMTYEKSKNLFPEEKTMEKPKYKKGYSDCDCGCNIPVASNPEQMLRFLAYRLEMAGVDEAVSVIYARDIRKILDEFYGGAEK